MATLTVHDIDDQWASELIVRAAQHGRSAEEEHREILRRALQRPTSKELAGRRKLVEELQEFQRRTGGRGGPTVVELLREGRIQRTAKLTGATEDEIAEIM